MAVIAVEDPLFARVGAPDLDEMEAFLETIGLVRSERTATRLYMRGTDPDPFLHVTHLGEPRFLALGFKAASFEDLQTLGAACGAPVEESDDFGGGHIVRLTDPNGIRVEVVHGAKSLPQILVPPVGTNTATEPEGRRGRGPWKPDSPPHVKRFGHAVMRTPRFAETVEWFQHHLGLKCSDQIVDSEGQVTGSFNRIDRGQAFVDHHALLINRSEACGWHHISYEVHSWSEVFEGFAMIRNQDRGKIYKPPSRHFLGGQVGAYFGDPCGRMVEFWSDSDRLNENHQPQNWTPEDIRTLGPNWDDGLSPEFRQVLSV